MAQLCLMAFAAMPFICAGAACSAESKDNTAGLSLQLALMREDVLPYEPLGFRVSIQNATKSDVKLSSGWRRCVVIEYCGEGSTEWARLDRWWLPQDSTPPAPPLNMVPGAKQEALIWMYGFDAKLNSLFLKSKYQCRVRMEYSTPSVEIISNVNTLRISTPEGVDDKACKSLMQLKEKDKQLLLFDMLPVNPMGDGRENRIKRIRAFVRDHQESRYALYYMRSCIVMCTDNENAIEKQDDFVRAYHDILQNRAPEYLPKENMDK